jgi:hypothetical protein
MNLAHDEPTDGTDVMWLIMSLLSLDVDQQLALLGELPPAATATEEALIYNNASFLLSALYEHYGAWFDEFEPCPSADRMFELVRRMDYHQSSREAFVESGDWKELRQLARRSLQEANLSPWPLRAAVDFSKYVEVVRPTKPEADSSGPM